MKKHSNLFFLKNKDIAAPYEASLTSSFCNTRLIYLKHVSQDPTQHLLSYSNTDNKKQLYFASWQINGQLSLWTFLTLFQHGISGNFNRWLHNTSTEHTSPSFQCLLRQQQTAPAEVTSHKVQRRRSFLFLPRISVSFAQTRQPVGLQQKLKWSCSW